MPRKIDGRPLSAKEHRQWKRVKASTGSGGAATNAVRRSRRRHRRE